MTNINNNSHFYSNLENPNISNNISENVGDNIGNNNSSNISNSNDEDDGYVYSSTSEFYSDEDRLDSLDYHDGWEDATGGASCALYHS